MKKNSKENFYDNRILKFTNTACDCEVDVRHISKGVKTYSFCLYPKDEWINFYYTNKQGLVSNKSRETGDGNAVLFDLLALKNGDVKSAKRFLEKHGFFFPIESESGTSIEAENLFGLINRIQATVSLMLQLSKKQINYKKVIALTMYLIISPQISFKLTNECGTFDSTSYELGDYWDNIHLIDERKLRVEVEHYNVEESCFVIDSIYPPFTELKAFEYEEAVHCGFAPPTSKKDKIIYLFRNAIEVGPDCRLAIDFLYHFFKEIGEFENWDHEGNLMFLGDEREIMERFRERSQLIEGLMKLAKNTLKTEIETNLRGIRPSYDTETMMPKWHVEYLLAGLYFSIFSMRPKIELYKECNNCGNLFRVNASTAHRIYCSAKCGNAATQRRHRMKKREEKNG